MRLKVFEHIVMAFERRYFNGVFNLLSSVGENRHTDAHGVRSIALDSGMNLK